MQTLGRQLLQYSATGEVLKITDTSYKYSEAVTTHSDNEPSPTTDCQKTDLEATLTKLRSRFLFPSFTFQNAMMEMMLMIKLIPQL